MQKMGCVTSKTDINDRHPNIFKVMNVDEMCNPLNSGQLEVTENDLVLHQRSRTPVHWPLKSLRRYGFDAQLFSFECGRRCPTGPGIFAFKCTRAEQLFNLLQSRVRNNLTDDTVSNSTHQSNTAEGNYLEPAPVQLRQNSTCGRWTAQNGRLSSVSSSNGPLSPLATSPSPPPAPPPPPGNPPKVLEGYEERPHSYTNSLELPTQSPPPPVLYANIDLTPVTPTQQTPPQTLTPDPGNITQEVLELPDEVPSSPLYMNVIPGQEAVVVSSEDPPATPTTMVPDLSDWEGEERHCYANLGPGELKLRGLPSDMITYPFTLQVPPTPPPQTPTGLNYIVLDLDNPSSPAPPPSFTPTSPDSPLPKEGYATIDFDRTEALCFVNNCPMIEDEGVRKTRHNSTFNDTEDKVAKRTRHNSTISELMAPITSRLSSSMAE